ncbi:ribulose bisphosphate carboxylase small chain [Striga asiatica]|uniref:Ribulose bisphosphate carboxylase small chain n=1 Tax=Striga asiatica TaxID=4170 RepID=A0A5A7PPM6_STRAF|nr:ribulose bisphosphate carboxylase small chain [Striga asiatica]
MAKPMNYNIIRSCIRRVAFSQHLLKHHNSIFHTVLLAQYLNQGIVSGDRREHTSFTHLIKYLFRPFHLTRNAKSVNHSRVAHDINFYLSPFHLQEKFPPFFDLPCPKITLEQCIIRGQGWLQTPLDHLLHDFQGAWENVEEGVERVQILLAAVLVHGQEHLDGLVGFSGGNVPLGDYGEGFGGGAQFHGPHSAHEGPRGLVVPQSGGDVDGVVEGGGGVAVRGVVPVEEVEELEGFGAMVPETFEDCLD